MCDDRANHDDGKQTGGIEGIAWNQQTDATRDLQKTGEIPEPLTAADFVEQFDRSTIAAAPANLAPPAPSLDFRAKY